jgi:hypothetical protein
VSRFTKSTLQPRERFVDAVAERAGDLGDGLDRVDGLDGLGSGGADGIGGEPEMSPSAA